MLPHNGNNKVCATEFSFILHAAGCQDINFILRQILIQYLQLKWKHVPLKLHRTLCQAPVAVVKEVVFSPCYTLHHILQGRESK